MVGLGDEQMALPVQLIATKEIKLTGVFRYVDTWPRRWPRRRCSPGPTSTAS